MYSIKVLDVNTKQVFIRISDERKLYEAEWDVLARLQFVRPKGDFVVVDSKILN